MNTTEKLFMLVMIVLRGRTEGTKKNVILNIYIINFVEDLTYASANKSN